MKQIMWAAALLVTPLAAAKADEPARLPATLRQLEGCWQGSGEVMGTPVATTARAHPVALDAILAFETNSVATGDATDRYGAHLVFGGGKAADEVTGFWSDSFGGSMTATGTGRFEPGGFEIGYRYSDAEFVNRWQIDDARLGWVIVARDGKGVEKPFASYTLQRVSCPVAPANP